MSLECDCGALLAAATAGEWDVCVLSVCAGGKEIAVMCDDRTPVQPRHDAALIAAARNALPGLTDELERLRGLENAAKVYSAAVAAYRHAFNGDDEALIDACDEDLFVAKEALLDAIDGNDETGTTR